ncbi:MAG: hypothetical protein ACD_54C01169G0002 [uncultured bacterium]|nr:MAG: hypothetical protein ACD_54C01169G0002 [uncultured bacterium]
MLALTDQGERVGEIQGIAAQRVRRDLTVENLAGEVRVIGGNLPPPLRAGVRSGADKANEFGGEGFQSDDLHGALRVCTSLTGQAAIAAPKPTRQEVFRDARSQRLPNGARAAQGFCLASALRLRLGACRGWRKP